MNYISNREPIIPTKLKSAISDVLVKFELYGARAAMGFRDTEEEVLFGELLDNVKSSKPSIHKAMVDRMKLPASQLKTHSRFKNFKNIDLEDKSALPNFKIKKFHGKYIKDLADKWVHIPTSVNGAGLDSFRDLNLPQARYKGLQFYLKEVKCFDETGSGWGEWGEDEIYLGGGSVDETGDVKTVSMFKVGNFDDGDRKVYRGKGKKLHYFNIREGGSVFPKIYTLALPMIEHDWGNLSRWYNKFIDKLRDIVEDEINALIASGAAAIGGVIGGPLGALAGAIAGWAIGKAIEIVRGWLNDDHLGTATISATINSYTGNWVSTGTRVSATYTRDYRGHRSHYRIKWYCELIS